MKSSTQIVGAHLKKTSRLRPSLAIVLGSGFHGVPSALRIDKKIPYAKIPGFPKPTVRGHKGELIFGHLGDTPVLALNGRSHFYEGHSMEAVTFPIRVLAELGIRDLLLTNAAGGINRKFRVGDLMLVTDHINFMGASPLRGEHPAGLPRFVDLTQTYDARLRELLLKAGRLTNVKLRRGVYIAVSGPNYETPAEIRAFARLGADAVGMSTVPEAIVGRQMGLRVAAISCITNPAAGLAGEPLAHGDVLAAGERTGTLAVKLLKKFAQLYSGSLRCH
ncbi:MAG TPA: purine-nucleoside phosphorylase [Desulfuromonadaceae bacterium]|nr:purine-nucleoside phosphorylase [Desulfuromonadaceae bacterium]